MRLVSEQSDAELRKRDALIDLKHALRRLTANLMRITRGAGASYNLPDQLADCLLAMRAYHDAAGCGVASDAMDEMLDLQRVYFENHPWIDEREWLSREDAGGFRAVDDARDEIYRASLQIVASTLVNQVPQLARGKSDFANALRALDDARECRRAIDRARYQQTPRPRRKPKSKP